MGSRVSMDWIEDFSKKLKERIKEQIKQMSLKNTMALFFLFALLFAIILHFLTIRICDNCIIMLNKAYFIYERYFTKGHDFYYIKHAITAEEKAVNKIYFFYILKQCSIIIYMSIGIYAAAHFYYKEKLKEPLHFLHQGAEHLSRNDFDFSFYYNTRDEIGEICQTFEHMRFQLIENQKEIWKMIENQRQLNAMFAHDLRTPLTVMRGYLDMLRKYYPLGMPEEKLMEILTVLVRQVERMEQFSDTMKKLHSIDELEIRKKSADLQELCRKIKENIEGMAVGLEISFESLVLGEPLFCSFDEAVILEVLDNIIGNALRYAKTKIIVKADLENDIFFLYVKDDGCGFSKNDQKHALRPYYSGSEKKQGHFGLGLTVANQLCHKHGGRLEITNSIDGGAIVCAIFSVSN